MEVLNELDKIKKKESGHVIIVLKDYRPIALTLVIMKCFEGLVLKSIKNSVTRQFLS